MRRLPAILCGVALGVASAIAPASASSGGQQSYGITEFSAMSSGSIAFTVTDIINPALLGSQSYTYVLQGSTGTSGGTVTITAPTIVGASGQRIAPGAFTATCTELYDRAGSFDPLATVVLSSSPVTCARLSSNSTVNAEFAVTLTLNCGTSAAVAFPADTYTDSSPLSVTANMP